MNIQLHNGLTVVEWANSMIPFVREKYGFGEEYEIKLFYQSENTTYMVKNVKTGEKTVLRICEPGYHTRDELKGETEFINAIKEYSDIVLPEPVKGLNGEYVQVIGQEEEEYYCVLFRFIEGETPKQEHLDELGGYFYKLGEVTAKMHKATIDSGISKKADRPTWTPEKLFGEKAILGNYRLCEEFSEKDMELFDKVEELIHKRLERYGINDNNYGLVHSDCRLANLMMNGDKIAVIDFDDSGYCWYLNDYGSAFSFIEDSEYVPMLSENWIKGYESIRHLSDKDKNEMDTFILIRRLLLQGFLYTHTESEAIKDGIHIEYAKGTVKLAERYLEKYGI